MKSSLLNFQNQSKLQGFQTTGKYDFPVVKPVFEIPNRQHYSWIGFNEVLSCKEKYNKMVHFFLYDQQFERTWNNLDKYTKMLKRFPAVLSPDFSYFTDSPKALWVWQTYRQRALAAYWQRAGITVIPTVSWSTPDSFDWCFDGLPTNSIIAVSTLGVLNNKQSTEYFRLGYEEMKRRLTPSEILCYGRIPEWLNGEVTEMGCRVMIFDSFNQVKGTPDEEYYRMTEE